MRNPQPSMRTSTWIGSNPPHGVKRPLLLFGIDGCRWDIAAEEGVAPHLQRLAQQGNWYPMTMEVPTISAPGWASILTGTTHAQHGITDNSCVGGRTWQNPDFLAKAFYRDQTSRTFAAAGWPVLVDPHGLGPIIHPRLDQQYAGQHRVVVRDGETFGYIKADAEVADITVAAVRLGAFDIGFSYACDVDDAGHIYGLLGEHYRAALSRVDAHLGRIVTALEERFHTYGEDWVLVVTTDHGHVDEGGHGGDSDRERESWVITWAPSGRTPNWQAPFDPSELCDLMLEAHFGAESEEV